MVDAETLRRIRLQQVERARGLRSGRVSVAEWKAQQKAPPADGPRWYRSLQCATNVPFDPHHHLKGFSVRQWLKLANLLDTREDGCLEGFVRFANGYETGRIGSVHFVHAIDLALNGVNVWGTGEQLTDLASDPETELTGNWSARYAARPRKPNRGLSGKRRLKVQRDGTLGD